MEFSYGQGRYSGEGKTFEGQIVLGEHKVYVRDENGDVASSFVPLDKVKCVSLRGDTVKLHVRPSLYFQYEALFKGEKKHMVELANDIVKRRGFKKKFLKNEWEETPS